MSDLAPLELAWAAGLFEGEGTIRINKATGRNFGALAVSVSNTDLEICQWLQQRWPGYMKSQKGKGTHRDYWVWVISARRAMAFLNQIEPYVVRSLVRERISLAREFQEHKHIERSLRDEEYAQDDFAFYLRMRGLNKRGRQDA